MPPTTAEQATKRLNLALPERLLAELQQTADEQETTVTELLRRFIKLGLLVVKLQDDPENGLYIRENGRERKVMLM